jgi:hypothetical protein
MRMRRIIVILLFAVIHFGLLALAIWQGLVIFRTPSTPSEIFWDHTMQVLLFPASLLTGIVTGKLWQTIVMVLNSLLWGLAFGSLYLRMRSRS